MAYVAAIPLSRRPSVGFPGRVVAARLSVPRAARFYSPMPVRRILPRGRVAALSAPVPTPPATSTGSQILQSSVAGAIQQAVKTGSASNVAKATATSAGVSIAATAALAIPVVGPLVSGAIALFGPMVGKHGLGSGCSPDETSLPGLAGIRMLTDNQGALYLAENPDVAAYYQKCGAVWSATPAQYASWHWYTFGNGKDGKSRTDPFTYPAASAPVAAAAGAVTVPATAAPSATDLATLALLSQQYQLQAAKLQQDAADAQAKRINDANAEVLRAQATVTSAQLSAQSIAAESANIAAGQAAQAQAQAAAAASSSQVEILRSAAALAQSRELAAAQATSAATASAEKSQTTKYVIIGLVVAAAIAGVTTLAKRRGPRLRLASA